MNPPIMEQIIYAAVVSIDFLSAHNNTPVTRQSRSKSSLYLNYASVLYVYLCIILAEAVNIVNAKALIKRISLKSHILFRLAYICGIVEYAVIRN